MLLRETLIFYIPCYISFFSRFYIVQKERLRERFVYSHFQYTFKYIQVLFLFCINYITYRNHDFPVSWFCAISLNNDSSFLTGCWWLVMHKNNRSCVRYKDPIIINRGSTILVIENLTISLLPFPLVVKMRTKHFTSTRTPYLVGIILGWTNPSYSSCDLGYNNTNTKACKLRVFKMFITFVKRRTRKQHSNEE